MTIELEHLLINSNKEEKEANQRRLNLNNAIEVETKTTIKYILVIGIITLLDIAFITLRDRRSNI